MITEDKARTHLPAATALIEALYESTNQPLVQPAGSTAQAAQAAVVGLRTEEGLDAGSGWEAGFEVVVALSLTQSGDNVLYCSDLVTEKELPVTIEDGLNFAESMGFILDSSSWQQLDESHREELVSRMPAFRAPAAKKSIAPVERARTQDPIAAVARLFAAFGLLASLSLGLSCAGMSSEQREKAAEIHYDLGTNMLNAGDSQGALKEYLEAEEDNPELANVHNGLGLIYAYSFNRWEEAEVQLKKAVALDPNFSEAQTNLGALFLSRGRFAEAVPLFEKAISNALYKDRVLAQCDLGWALYKTGSVDKALSELKAALALAPRYCLGWRQMGTIYSEQGKLEMASEAFSKYASSCPDVADAHLLSGKLLARLSRATEARAEFERCAASKSEREAKVAGECARFLKELGNP